MVRRGSSNVSKERREYLNRLRCRKAASILEDEFSRTVIKGALKSLKWISILSLDIKLAAIVTALEAYVLEQEKVIEEKKNRPEAMPFGYRR